MTRQPHARGTRLHIQRCGEPSFIEIYVCTVEDLQQTHGVLFQKRGVVPMILIDSEKQLGVYWIIE